MKYKRKVLLGGLLLLASVLFYLFYTDNPIILSLTKSEADECNVSNFPWQNYSANDLIDWTQGAGHKKTAVASNVSIQVQGLLVGDVDLVIAKNLRVSGSYGKAHTVFVFDGGNISVSAGELGFNIERLYLTEKTKLTGNLQRIEKFYYMSEGDLAKKAMVVLGLLGRGCEPRDPIPTNIPRSLSCDTPRTYPFPQNRVSTRLSHGNSVNKIEANNVILSGDGYAYVVVANNLTLSEDASVQKAYVFNRLTLSDNSDVSELRGSGATIISPPGTRVYHTYNTISRPRLKTLAMIAAGRLPQSCEDY